MQCKLNRRTLPEKSKLGGGNELGNCPRREMRITAQSSIQTQQLFYSVQPYRPNGEFEILVSIFFCYLHRRLVDNWYLVVDHVNGFCYRGIPHNEM